MTNPSGALATRALPFLQARSIAQSSLFATRSLALSLSLTLRRTYKKSERIPIRTVQVGDCTSTCMLPGPGTEGPAPGVACGGGAAAASLVTTDGTRSGAW